jgi:hypothetical protein
VITAPMVCLQQISTSAMTMASAIRTRMIGSTANGNQVDRSNPVNSVMTTERLLYGWNPGLDIPSAIRRPARDCIAPSHVLVSMVDSTPGVAQLPSLVPLLVGLGASYREVGDDIVIGGDTLLSLSEEEPGFFTGFDEIWLFRVPPTQSKPKSIRLTSDTPLEQEPPDGVVEWMREGGCFAGFGDGDGLNYVTFKPVLAELWSR